MIQIYTGEGKGKTTASVGLAARASKHCKVLFIQLIKSGDSSEVSVLQNTPNIEYKAFGSGEWILEDTDKSKEAKNCQNALKYVRGNLKNYDVVVIDEAITAVDLGLLDESDILSILAEIPDDKEVVLTGRGATEKLIERADLVSEMKKIKHYYDKGVEARKGIEL
ncbi:MAG: cob(I)yrinic acid a,c-diamide adenosyltransferase [bacterium]|nr:cob(I)yrinic acid a,c-diamide adenosyltransferase [bacterium]